MTYFQQQHLVFVSEWAEVALSFNVNVKFQWGRTVAKNGGCAKARGHSLSSRRSSGHCASPRSLLRQCPSARSGVLNPDHSTVCQNWKGLHVFVMPLPGFCRKIAIGGCLVNGVAQVAPLLLECARMCHHLRSKGPAEQQLGTAETVGTRRISELQEAGTECIDIDVAIRSGFR